MAAAAALYRRTDRNYENYIVSNICRCGYCSMQCHTGMVLLLCLAATELLLNCVLRYGGFLVSVCTAAVELCVLR